MVKLAPVRVSTLKATVVQSIRDAIFTGRFGPGDALRELHLGAELGVSQPTVREALFELERQGLVIRTPNVGTVVTNLSIDELRDQIEVRIMLEKVAAVKACERMTPEELRTLELRLAGLTSAIAASSYHQTAQADLEFHRHIWVCSGNRALARALDQVAVPLFAMIGILRSAVSEDLLRLITSHVVIVEALRKRDPVLVEEIMGRHGREPYVQILNSGAQDCQELVLRKRSAESAVPA